MQCRFFSLFTLVLVGCGAGTPKENPTPPLVEITQGDQAPPIDTRADDAESDKRNWNTAAVELPDGCLEKMREGRGLPAVEMTTEAGRHYTEALAHERADRLNDARKGFLMVVQSYPQSRLIPLVYFAFGELFFREGQTDPMKLVFAEQSFKEVTKYPAPENTAMSYALFRLGQIFATGGKGPEALNMLNKFMTLAETQPDAQCAKALGDSGRKLIASTYAEVGEPRRAFSFFVHSTVDRESGKTNALEMLANLCDIYIRQQKPADAAAALVAVNEDHAGWAFCTREGRIIEHIAPTIAASTKDELVRKHAARCQ